VVINQSAHLRAVMCWTLPDERDWSMRLQRGENRAESGAVDGDHGRGDDGGGDRVVAAGVCDYRYFGA